MDVFITGAENFDSVVRDAPSIEEAVETLMGILGEVEFFYRNKEGDFYRFRVAGKKYCAFTLDHIERGRN